MPREPENFRTFYADPGESFGWSLGQDTELLSGGTGKMWEVARDLWDLINNPTSVDNPLNWEEHLREGAVNTYAPIGRIVCEDFRIYPWKVNSLKFDRVRTANVLGALQFMAMINGFPFIRQGANIKKAAQAAGAEEYYLRPLHENRHQNDSIQHFVFFTNVHLMGNPLPIPDGYEEDEEAYH